MASASSRAFSPPPTSFGASSTTGHTQTGTIASRVVHKLAIEGRCNAEDAGASLRLFMKIVLPVEGLVPGASVPLFPEENVRIVTSKVQPLDSTSTPYAFSSTAVPLLHKAARALGLPARSNKSYYTFLGIPPPAQTNFSPLDSSSRRAAAAAPLPLSVTGEINVSNFHICFILPRILPTRGAVLADNEDHPTPRQNRRASFADGKTILFMAGVEIFVPFISGPPKAPYQLSLPLPRCLSNHIKLRVMPPVRRHSGPEPPPWDLTSDPLVTYKTSHGARSTSYEQMADDEVSLEDSVEVGTVSASSSGVQGSFPSAERIRIRWAAPMNRNQGLGVLADGRRRVGVDEALGSMRCTVLGRDDQDRFKVRLEYEGTCKGLWFPGVATQVGLVVVLDGKGRQLQWASEDERWEITGGSILNGFDGQFLPQISMRESAEEPQETPTPARPSLIPSRLSSYGGASLLQTALPNNSLLPDYSFETTPSPTVSMIDSTGSRYGQSSTSSGVLLSGPPEKEITLFLNISDLPPPPTNEFNFKITGTILIGASKDADDAEEDDSPALPVFRVLPTDRSRIEVTVVSEMQHEIEVIFPKEGKARHDMPNGLRTPRAQPRRKYLRRKASVQAEDGVRIRLSVRSPTGSPQTKASSTPRTPVRDTPRRPAISPRTPRSRLISSPLSGVSYPIPWVRATVELLPSSKQHSQAIQFSVPATAATDGVLSFGVCLPSYLSSNEEPAVDVVSATADGVALPFEVFPRNSLDENEHQPEEKYRGNMKLVDYAGTSGEPRREETGDMALHDIDCWIRITIPDEIGFGTVDVHYLVARDPSLRHKKLGSKAEHLSILLPSFHVGVGTYTVNFRTPRGFKDPLILSNFHQQEDSRLSHYRLPAYFYPQVRAQIERQAGIDTNLAVQSLKATGWVLSKMMSAIPAIASIIMLWILITIREDIRDAQFLSNLPLASSWAANLMTPSNNRESTTTTATFPYTVDTSTATPYNNQPSGPKEVDIARQVYSLMPLPLAMLPRLDWARLADALLMSVEKLLGFFQAVIHYPTPP